VLQDNGGNNLALASGATSFTFSTPISSGGTYNVTVLTQPSSPAETCAVTNGSGTAAANVTNVQVSCTTTTYTIGGRSRVSRARGWCCRTMAEQPGGCIGSNIVRVQYANPEWRRV